MGDVRQQRAVEHVIGRACQRHPRFAGTQPPLEFPGTVEADETRTDDQHMRSIRTGLPGGSADRRVIHISFGRPLISALHEPHLPALQFQHTARSPA